MTLPGSVDSLPHLVDHLSLLSWTELLPRLVLNIERLDLAPLVRPDDQVCNIGYGLVVVGACGEG